MTLHLMPLEPKNRPDYCNAAHGDVLPFIELVRDVSAGTQQMRAKGVKYLPKEKREIDGDYNFRRDASVLFGGYHKTVSALVGLVCKNEIELGSDVPSEIVAQIEDVDLKGNHLDVFVKHSFTDQFEGASIYLVDMPPPVMGTAEDEQRAGVRPYWVHYRRDDVINYRMAKVNGETQFTLIVFREVAKEADGDYGEVNVTRLREFRRGDDGVVRWKLTRVNEKESDETKRYVLEAEGSITLDRIPVAVSGDLCAHPPLIDIANLNISHWRNNSDQENILHVTRIPILTTIGVPKEQLLEMVNGVSSTLCLPKECQAMWLEIKADGAVKAGREHLLDIEQRMGMLGLSTLTQRQGSTVTATEKRIDHGEKTSGLATMARSEKDAIELALHFHAQYLGLESGGSIQLGVIEDEMILTPQHMQVMLDALKSNNFALDTFLTAMLALLQRAGVLAEDIDVKDEAAKIEAATKKAAENTPPPLLLPNQPPINGGVQ